MRICSFVLFLSLFAALSAHAQSTGTIRGTLTDDSGAVIPAASVTIAGSGAPRAVQTQADGSFVATGLPPGNYHVKVAFPGFAPFDKQVAVTAGASVSVPIQMQIRAEKQEVTVAA